MKDSFQIIFQHLVACLWAQQKLQHASLHKPSSNNNETLNSSSSSDVISGMPQLSDTFAAQRPSHKISRPLTYTHIVSNCKSTRKVCSIKFYLKCHSISLPRPRHSVTPILIPIDHSPCQLADLPACLPESFVTKIVVVSFLGKESGRVSILLPVCRCLCTWLISCHIYWPRRDSVVRTRHRLSHAHASATAHNTFAISYTYVR